MLKIIVAAGLAATALSPALASPRTAVVRTADLNIASEAGRSTLVHRISRAAEKVCGTADLRNLKDVQSASACKSGAVSAALAQLGIGQDTLALAAR